MSELASRLKELPPKGVLSPWPCPECGGIQAWWLPRSGYIKGNSEYDKKGLSCAIRSCGFTVELYEEPPDIMCAVCGDVLHMSSDNDIVFSCQGCDRTVTP